VEAGVFPGGKMAGHPVAKVGDFEHFQEVRDLLLGVRDAVNFRKYIEILPYQQVGGKIAVGRGGIEPAQDLDAVVVGVHAEDADAAAGRLDHAENAAHGRGLARAVGTKEPKHFAALNLKTQVLNGHVVSKLPVKFVNGENWFGHAGEIGGGEECAVRGSNPRPTRCKRAALPLS
jgi:hypothetical protein